MSYDKDQKWWYVGAQNDGLFVIDAPPRPLNDYVNPDQDVNVIAALGTNQAAAELLVHEHNEKVSLINLRHWESNAPGTEELLSGITSGRWGYDLNGRIALVEGDLEWGKTLFQIPGKTTPELTPEDHANGQFVAHAPRLVRALLSLILIHRKESESMMDEVQKLLLQMSDVERENARLRRIAVDLEHDLNEAVRQCNEDHTHE